MIFIHMVYWEYFHIQYVNINTMYKWFIIHI